MLGQSQFEIQKFQWKVIDEFTEKCRATCTKHFSKQTE